MLLCGLPLCGFTPSQIQRMNSNQKLELQKSITSPEKSDQETLDLDSHLNTYTLNTPCKDFGMQLIFLI